jgi:acyl-CoA reductase-like NAD-dependent aldehyde dehydrogenase
VAIITPWNNPFYIPLGKIAPALLHGNSVVWKPAPAAEALADHVLRLVAEAGPLPEALFSCRKGDGQVALELMNDDLIDAVTLTGSLQTGRAAQDICARRHIPLQAELGGNNAAMVWEDADLPTAARAVAEGAFAQAGQRCTANRRVVVHRSCRDRFLELLQHETALLPWGDPLNPSTRIGSLVSAAHRERMDALVRSCTADLGPAIMRHSASPSADWGHHEAWYPPTILCCEDPSHALVQQETFGPILVVQTADDWRQAISLLNGVSQGLAAALFTRSRELMELFFEEARAGILKINQSTADAGLDVPFGGWKSSGLGPPEHGRFDREFFTRPQAIYLAP